MYWGSSTGTLHYMAILHLLMGLPGSGKSTLAKKLEHETGAIRLSSDELRLVLFPQPTFSQNEHDALYEILDKTVDTLLEKGYDVVYDANLNRRMHRDEKYALARAHHTRIVLWWVDTDREVAKDRRLSEQNHILIPDGDTPENLFERITRVLEEPDATEPCIKVDGSDIANVDVQAVINNK